MNDPKLQRLRALSLFADEQITKLNQHFINFYQTKILDRKITSCELAKQLNEQISRCKNEEQLAQILRIFRNLHQIRLIYRMVNNLSNYHEAVDEISQLACTCLDITYKWLYRNIAKQYGRPLNLDNSDMHMVIIGMGKLGGRELNLSSDIDLIFTYPTNGKTNGKTPIEHHEFFTKLGQKLIKALHQTTIDGLVFRVDMRLRPFGSNSNLVLPFDALIQYYQTQGRDWERYALIKAYPVAGNIEDGLELMEILRPFVYRHYLDFSAIAAMREMKSMIIQEVQLNNRKDNIKLGEGGIREVEFIAQVLQLIYGGKNKNLQHRNLLQSLNEIGKHNFLPTNTIDELINAYIFLRNTEHALQAIDDRQNQELPKDVIIQNKIADILGFTNWHDFYTELNVYRQIVAKHFANLITDEASKTFDYEKWNNLWNSLLLTLHKAENLDVTIFNQIMQLGFTNGKKIAHELYLLQQNAQKKASINSVNRLNLLMPKLLSLISEKSNSDEVFMRILPLIYAVLRRSSYFSLLNENMNSLHQLINLCAKSSLLAEQITRYPVLLDELLDVNLLCTAPSTCELNQQLANILNLHRFDFEKQLEKLREFKLAHSLKACYAYLVGNLTFMQLSDYLTFLAETILHQTLNLSWMQTTEKYGNPPNSSLKNPNFIIVGYGKLGGLELSLGSDLDLVFLYDENANIPTINTNKPIDSAQFYARLTQKIIHILTVQTVSGNLYEIDLRLRPSGSSGLLVSNINAFENYQLKSAQTWEHQSLLRARVLVGNDSLRTKFEKIRNKIINLPRNLDELRNDIRNMRTKMHQNSSTSANMFNLKTDAGAIIDLEFIVQFLVLAYAKQNPQLSLWTDNIRMLDEIGNCGLLPIPQIQNLQQIYLKYRSCAHELYLQKQQPLVDKNIFANEKEQVINLWHELNLS